MRRLRKACKFLGWLGLSQQTEKKYSVQCVDEYSGFIDYFSGHGHAPGPLYGAIGCVTLQCWPSNQSTWQEIAEELKGDQSEFEDLTEDKHLDSAKANQAVIGFLNEKYVSTNDKDREFKPFSDWEDQGEDFGESATYLIVLHIFEE